MQGYLLMQGGTEHKVGESWPRIECFRCGICCIRYRPKVTSEEMELIAQKLSMSIDMFISAYVRAVPTKEAYILQSSADTCPFLRWGEGGARATCSIYLFRPEACRNWIPSLSRPECREGLTRVKAVSELLLPGGMYHSGKEIKRLSSAVKNDSGASS